MSCFHFIHKYVLLSSMAVAILLGITNQAKAAVNVDSFFDIWIELAARGELDLNFDASSSPPGGGNRASFANIDTEMLSMDLSSPSSPPNDPVPDRIEFKEGLWHVDSFFDVTYRLEEPSSGLFIVDSFFDVFTELTINPEPTIDPVTGAQTFETEMLSMDLRSAEPDLNNSDNQLRLAPGPGHKHHGHVTILKISNPGGDDDGLFRVDSFFDIFTELSVDGGSTFHTSTESIPLSSSIVTVPEPSSVLLMAFGAVGLAFGAWRRKKKAAA